MRDLSGQGASPSSVLLVGDLESAEFAPTIAWLESQFRVLRGPSLETAGSIAKREPVHPSLVVIFHSRPGSLSQPAMTRLAAQLPLARLVSVLGTWCEGEARSGRPCPGAARVYWHQAQSRIHSELAHEIAAQRSLWILPRTASDTERMLAAVARPPATLAGRMTVICTRQRATFDGLADTCTSLAMNAIWLPEPVPVTLSGVAAGIWDGDLANEFDGSQLQAFTRELAPIPVLALSGFLRWDEVQKATECGAAAVSSKPYWIADLADALSRLFDPPQSGSNRDRS